MRVLLTREAIDQIKIGKNPQDAVDIAINKLKSVNGLGGIILLSHKGIGFSFNTPRMAFAYRTNNSDMIIGINPEDR